MGGVVQCDYLGQDDIAINEAIQDFNFVEVFGSVVDGTPYCSTSAAIVGRKNVRMDFHGTFIKPSGDYPVVEMVNGFTLEGATIFTAGLTDYAGPAVAFTGVFQASYPTIMRDVVLRGSSSSKTGVGVAVISDQETETNKVTHAYFYGVHIHNYEVGLLLRDVNPESNLDWTNANYYQGRITGSLRGVELEHANGNHIVVDWQPSPDSLSGLRCHNCSHNIIDGMFWDSHILPEPALQLDAGSQDNRIRTPLAAARIEDLGANNVVQ